MTTREAFTIVAKNLEDLEENEKLLLQSLTEAEKKFSNEEVRILAAVHRLQSTSISMLSGAIRVLILSSNELE